MSFSALASVTGHALCGVAVGTTCEECQNSFYNMSEGQQIQEANANTTSANIVSHNEHADEQKEDSKRTIQIDDKATSKSVFKKQESVTLFARPNADIQTDNKPTPTSLLKKEESITLFARPIADDDPINVPDEERIDINKKDLKTKIQYQKDGEESVFEVRQV
jgi:hypothetical protein